MDQNLFERRYMEKSWKKGKKYAYRRFIVESSVKKLCSFLKSKKIKGRLLDVGSGTGKNAIFFDQKGFDVLGVDFASPAIKLCKTNAKREKSKAKFKVADVVNGKFKQDDYDVVIDCGCLHHIRRKYWKKYLKNILKSIRTGGYYYLHGFDDSKYNSRFFHKNRKWVIRKGHYTCFFSTKEIKDFFGKDFKFIKTYQFLSLDKRFMVRAFYMRRK